MPIEWDASVVERVARLVAMTIAVLGILLLMGAALNSNVHPDADAYWLAAQRIRDGHELYSGPTGDETEIYRYAPWFAYAWVPLTYLGREGAFLAWRAILLLGTLAAVWPLLRRPNPAAVTLAILLGGLLITNLPAANVTPLVVGSLAIGLRTRAGPVILGVAGSLKLFPLIFVAGYLAERRWLEALTATVIGLALWLHVLAFTFVGDYAQVARASFFVGGVSLYSVSPIIWAAVAGSIGLALLRMIRERSGWTWLTSAIAIPLAVPRVWLPDAAYILAGIGASRANQSGQEGR